MQKPTARIYYTKLLEETHINATFNTLKCKVRHLKGTLQKARDLINSLYNGEEDTDGETTNIRGKIDFYN